MHTEAVIILPHQLFYHHPAITNKKNVIYLVEDAYFFTRYNFHKQKLILHRASMKEYEAHLIKTGHDVVYIEYKNSELLFDLIKKAKIKVLHASEFIEYQLEHEYKKYAQHYNVSLIIHNSPMFISESTWLEKSLSGKKHLSMNHFYIMQRKRLNILLDADKKPIGGKWSYDAENRMPYDESIGIPAIPRTKKSKILTEAIEYIEKHFADNPGDIDTFAYPISFAQADHLLEKFLEKKLNNFGPYQDAIESNEPFMFHSILSSSLNIGILTPRVVIEKTLAFAQHHKTRLSSLEGFIRQIIGWREFVYGVYLVSGEKQRKSNFFEHTRSLPESFWQGTTSIEPVDSCIKRVLKHAYAHHIERLMILGNFMLVCEINPKEVYAWFMELFIDAYDWVMVPNVFGMSQYADGGTMVTKPYFSGSNYILKMSNYKKGSWSTIWDALYWHFMLKNKNMLLKNPRLRLTASYLKRMTPAKMAAYKMQAQEFLGTFKQ